MKRRLPLALLAACALLFCAACRQYKPELTQTDPAETVSAASQTESVVTTAATEETTEAEAPESASLTPATTAAPVTAAPTTETAYITPATDPTEPTTAQPETAAPETAPPAASSGVYINAKGYEVRTENGFTYVDGVLIANKTYSVPGDYNPGDLTADTYAAFNRMKAGAAADGIDLFIVSGFRSFELQTSLYNRYVSSDGKALADRYSARPGHSEHQTGYAMDLNSLSQSFADTAEGRWIAANCYKYGFILRYPKGKEAQTGYMYEPWHVRYIGEERAAAIYNSGLCLEEYYGITSVYQ